MKFRTIIFAISLALASGAAMASNKLDDGVTAMLRGDNAAALKVFRPLATHGNAEAQYYMGYMYQSGTGVPVDKTKALEWYNRAAAQGHAGASVQAQVLAHSHTVAR